MEQKILRVNADIHKKIKLQAIAEDTSIEKLVTKILEDYIREK